MAIDLVRMPPELSVGFTRSLNFGTQVVRLDGAHREANATLESPILTWHMVKGLWRRNRLEEFEGFARARRGGLHAFRFWDPTDFSTNSSSPTAAPGMLDQFIGYGDGVTTTFPLYRKYASTPNDLPQRLAIEDSMLPIHGEVDDRLAAKLGLSAGTTFNMLAAVDGVSTPSFTLSLSTREITFSAPPAMDGAVTWGGYYDWPAVLDQDTDANLERIAESWEAQTTPSIGLECVPFERMLPETDDPGGLKSYTVAAGSPLLDPLEARWWMLTVPSPSMSCRIPSPAGFPGGGPHLVLVHTGSNTIAVLDSLTGSTIVNLASGQKLYLFVEVVGATKSWRYFTV